jgi:hypothetical protein
VKNSTNRLLDSGCGEAAETLHVQSAYDYSSSDPKVLSW